MKKILVVLSSLLIMLSLVACSTKPVQETTAEPISVPEPEHSIEYVKSGRVVVADRNCIAIFTKYTNNSSESVMPADWIDITAYQNGTEIYPMVPTGQETDGYIQCDTMVQSGVTADVVWIYELKDESTVSVEMNGKKFNIELE